MKYERIEKTIIELNDEVINEILDEVGYTKEEAIEESGSVEDFIGDWFDEDFESSLGWIRRWCESGYDIKEKTELKITK